MFGHCATRGASSYEVRVQSKSLEATQPEGSVTPFTGMQGRKARPMQMEGDAQDQAGAQVIPTLNSLWVGENLTYIERLSLQSALAHGHKFKLHSYSPATLTGVPEGVEVCDASEVMSQEKLISYAECENGVALGANLWRYHMLAQGLGAWCDLDLVFLKPLDLSRQYIVGWEHEGWINNAVLYAPKDSQFVRDLFELTKPNVRPPWFGPRRSLYFYLRRWRRGYLGLEDMPWGTYAAGLVTHIVKTRRLQAFVEPPEVFYPVRWSEARQVYDDAHVVDQKITPDTRTVHLWHSRLGELVSSPPPPGSWIGQQCERYGVEF